MGKGWKMALVLAFLAMAGGMAGGQEQERMVSYDLNYDRKWDGWDYYQGDKLVRMERDTDFDGKVDQKRFFFYEAGRLLRVEEDSNNDGRIDWVERYLYEGDRLVRREKDLNHDGIVDGWLYVEQGMVAEVKEDRNTDGKLDLFEHYQDGILAQSEEDANYDGQIDTWKHYKGKSLERIESDQNKDGKPDQWHFYAQGGLERMEQDLDYDGKVDEWNYFVRNLLVMKKRETGGQTEWEYLVGGWPKIESLLERAPKEDFAQLARKHSEDPDTAPQGGDLGYRKRGELPVPLEEVAWKLKVGEVSDIVRTPAGFYLLKLTEKQEDAIRLSQILVR